MNTFGISAPLTSQFDDIFNRLPGKSLAPFVSEPSVCSPPKLNPRQANEHFDENSKLKSGITPCTEAEVAFPLKPILKNWETKPQPSVCQRLPSTTATVIKSSTTVSKPARKFMNRSVQDKSSKPTVGTSSGTHVAFGLTTRPPLPPSVVAKQHSNNPTAEKSPDLVGVLSKQGQLIEQLQRRVQQLEGNHHDASDGRGPNNVVSISTQTDLRDLHNDTVHCDVTLQRREAAVQCDLPCKRCSAQSRVFEDSELSTSVTNILSPRETLRTPKQTIPDMLPRGANGRVQGNGRLSKALTPINEENSRHDVTDFDEDKRKEPGHKTMKTNLKHDRADATQKSHLNSAIHVEPHTFKAGRTRTHTKPRTRNFQDENVTPVRNLPSPRPGLPPSEPSMMSVHLNQLAEKYLSPNQLAAYDHLRPNPEHRDSGKAHKQHSDARNRNHRSSGKPAVSSTYRRKYAVHTYQELLYAEPSDYFPPSVPTVGSHASRQFHDVAPLHSRRFASYVTAAASESSSSTSSVDDWNRDGRHQNGGRNPYDCGQCASPQAAYCVDEELSHSSENSCDCEHC